ncbi:MAG TPA: hypothetical protein VFP44_03750 [Usitatibacter sp.]|nr:hypothetical protein [Usitatibacter sp.]
MNLTLKLGALAVASAFAFVAGPVLAAEDNPHAKHEKRVVLNAGQKWKTDAVTRRGMESIREQVNAVRASSRLAPMQPEYYAALGESIKREVGEILVASKLEPSAGQNFHVIVNQLVTAADTLEGKNGADRANGMDHADRVLSQYTRFFDHPGWQDRA